MKFVIAPDSFKESLNAKDVSQAIAHGIHKALPDAECICVPMADGGEGTAETLCAIHEGTWQSVNVSNPRGEIITAHYAILPEKRAVIEMAASSGLALLTPEQRNPLLTSTYGVGEMILDALSRDIRTFIIGIGGSATNDGGSGMLAALGVKFYDDHNTIIPLGAAPLSTIHHIDISELDKRLNKSNIMIACDVTNPLLGEYGASTVFGPQKGADPEMVTQLDNALSHYAEKIVEVGYPDHRHTPGSGAAGGLGFALFGLPNCTRESGSDLVIRESGLAEQCVDADYVITGEGRMDSQTLLGKVPTGVLQCVHNISSQHNSTNSTIPVIAICGCLGEDVNELLSQGFAGIFPIIPYLDTLDNTLLAATTNLSRTAHSIAQLIKAQATDL